LETHSNPDGLFSFLLPEYIQTLKNCQWSIG
jgi:hypothetical protein